MHYSPDAFDCGSAIVTDATSRIAVRQTCALFWGTTNVLESRKKSPPFATVTGDVVVMVPVGSLIRRLNRPASAEATE